MGDDDIDAADKSDKAPFDLSSDDGDDTDDDNDAAPFAFVGVTVAASSSMARTVELAMMILGSGGNMAWFIPPAALTT